jgi:hypothetical protein
MPRPHRLAARREAQELRRAVQVERQDPQGLVVSVRAELSAQQAARMGLVLADLVSAGPQQARIDLAGSSQIVGLGEVFTTVATVARAHRTRVTVHRASAEQRAVLRRYGLDHLLLYSDQAP